MRRLAVLCCLWLCTALVSAARAQTEPSWRSPEGLRAVSLTYAAGVGAAALTVPSMMLIGAQIGKSTNDLAAAAVPSLLLMAVVPPLSVAGAEWLVARRLGQRVRFHPAVWAAVGVNVVAMLVGSLAGVWAEDGTSIGLFTVAEALIMPAAMTAAMYGGRRAPAPVMASGPALGFAF